MLSALAWIWLVVMPPAARAEPPIRSGCEIDYPPFCIVDESGQTQGFSVELMREALEAMGREVTFRTGPWAEVRGWLEQGEVDALPLVGRTPEREALFDFTFPYMSLHGAIVVRRGKTDIRGMDDLRARHVAVMKGDNAEEFLRREDRGIHIHTTPTFEAALLELSEGRYDAVLTQRLVALRLIQQTGLTNLHVIDKPVEGFRQDFCFAVREGDRDTLALLNEGLAIVMADGTYRHLHAKWFAAMQLPSHRRIVVGGDSNFPPFEYLDEAGQPAGYNVDLTRAIAREMGLDVEVRLGPWAEIRRALAEGEVDALQGMFYSTERDLTFDFTPPHTVVSYVAVVREGEGPAPNTLDQLAGRQLVVQRDDIMHDFARENGLDERLVAVPAQEDALRELVQGKHDCALVARMTALFWITKHGWEGTLRLAREPLLAPQYCYAVPNNQKALLAQLSEGLKLLEESGEYRRIHNKWLGVYRGPPPPLLLALRYSAMVLVPLLLLLLAVVFWSWSLRRQVASRTRELRESVEFQQAMIACSPVALYSIDPEGTVLSWNASAERIFGWTADEVLGKPLPIVPQEKRQEFEALRRQVMEGEGFVGKELMRLRKDGTLFPMSLSVAPIRNQRGEKVAIMSAAEDITERKKSRERVEHLNHVLRAVRNVNQLITHETDRESLLRQACQILTRTRGYRCAWVVIFGEEGRLQVTAESGIGDAFAEIRAKLQRGDWPPCCRQALDGPGIAVMHNTVVNCKVCPVGLTYRDTAALAGALRHSEREYGVLVTALPAALADEPQEQMLFEELSEDIGYALHSMEMAEEHRRTEAALRESEARYRALFDGSADGILIADVATKELRYANPSMCEFLGYSQAELSDMKVMDLHPPGELSKVLAEFEAQSRGEKTLAEDIPCLQKDGTVVYADVNAVTISVDGRPCNVGFFRDITERKRAEQEKQRLESQLFAAQKMETVGRLAGGIAHDFNNLLTGIAGLLNFAREASEEGSQIHTDLSEALTLTERATTLTGQLLAFSRRQTLQPVVLDMNSLIDEQARMLRRLIGEDIELKFLPDPDLGNVRADPGQMQQIIMNLAVNACDAMPDGGSLTIETANAELDEEYARVHVSVAPGRYVMIAVSDTGSGMDEQTRAQVFEPFFTTKELGHGTGLGLSTVYGIVKQHNGNVWVYSEPGKGTTFKVYLPRCEDEVDTRQAARGAQTPSGGGETILLVEDEPAVLKLIQRMLTRLGYAVLVAQTPTEAVALAREHGGNIDLLLTDVVMPEMNGRELAERLRRRWPHIRVLFMSGYTANVIAHRGVLDDDVWFIQKPFSAHELATRLRQVLQADA